MNSSNSANIYLSSTDHRLLSLLIAAVGSRFGNIDRLRMELGRAIVLEPSAVPSNAAGLNSRVEVVDLDSGEQDTYVLTLPAAANSDERRISVLAPVGMALLGFREGDVVEWPTPGGLRRLRLERVTREPAPTAAPAAG